MAKGLAKEARAAFDRDGYDGPLRILSAGDMKAHRCAIEMGARTVYKGARRAPLALSSVNSPGGS